MNCIVLFQGCEAIEHSAVMEAFEASLDVRPRTKAAYVEGARKYVGWIRGEGRTGRDRADVIAYREALLAEYKPSTVSARLTAVRVLYDYLEGLGWPNAARGVKTPRKAAGYAKDPLTIQQAKAVLDGIDRTTFRGVRDYAIISLMLHTGLRTNEVALADVGDLRLQGAQMVLYVQGKGHVEKDAFVVITGTVEDAIAKYMRMRGHVEASEPLFASASRRNLGERMDRKSVSAVCKEAFRRAGIDSERITAHSLRHSAVTYALMGGATIQQAQAMARHSDPRTTMVYAHNLERLTAPAEGAVEGVLGFRFLHEKPWVFVHRRRFTKGGNERMRTICVAADKGGVGKTSTAQALAAVGMRDGLRVLQVDLDPQGTLTHLARVGALPPEATAWGILSGKSRTKSCIAPSEAGDIVPYNPRLRGMEKEALRTKAGGLDALAKALAGVSGDYDLAVIDTPPSMDFSTKSGLYAANAALVPTIADFNATATFRPMMDEVGALKGRTGRPERLAVFLNLHDGRTRVAKAYEAMLVEYCGSAGVPFFGTVRKSVATADAQARGACAAVEDPAHPQAKDWTELARKTFGLAGLDGYDT